MKKPIIGITLDSEKKKTYSKFPWYALRENYLTSLTKFNAIPFPLLHEKKYIDDFDSYAKNTEPLVDLKLTRIECIERYKRCLNNEKS